MERATARPTFDDDQVTDDVVERLRGLAGIADRRGQSLAQLALAWVLRDHSTVASTLIGASSVAQLDENLGALKDVKLAEIDRYAVDSVIDLWRVAQTSEPSSFPETLGAWVIKCNPRRTPVDPAAGRARRRWCVAGNYGRG